MELTTKTFSKVISDNPYFLNSLVLTLHNQDFTEKANSDFKRMIQAKYNIYNVAYETTEEDGDEEFIDRFTDIFNLYKKEYEEKLNMAYENINWERVHTFNEDLSMSSNDSRSESSNTTTSQTDNLDSANYDMPHAQSNGYKTSENIGQNTSSGNGTKTYTTNNNYGKDSNTQSYEGGNQVEQRNKFYEMFKNIMLEFVNEFKPVFIMVYY